MRKGERGKPLQGALKVLMVVGECICDLRRSCWCQIGKWKSIQVTSMNSYTLTHSHEHTHIKTVMLVRWNSHISLCVEMANLNGNGTSYEAVKFVQTVRTNAGAWPGCMGQAKVAFLSSFLGNTILGKEKPIQLLTLILLLLSLFYLHRKFDLWNRIRRAKTWQEWMWVTCRWGDLAQVVRNNLPVASTSYGLQFLTYHLPLWLLPEPSSVELSSSFSRVTMRKDASQDEGKRMHKKSARGRRRSKKQETFVDEKGIFLTNYSTR